METRRDIEKRKQVSTQFLVLYSNTMVSYKSVTMRAAIFWWLQRIDVNYYRLFNFISPSPQKIIENATDNILNLCVRVRQGYQ